MKREILENFFCTTYAPAPIAPMQNASKLNPNPNSYPYPYPIPNQQPNHNPTPKYKFVVRDILD